jgi:hypothetical protein
MQTLHVEIVNPKAQKLLSDLMELKLIRIKPFDVEKHVHPTETHLASEYVLIKDWSNPQEDEAWKDL